MTRLFDCSNVSIKHAARRRVVVAAARCANLLLHLVKRFTKPTAQPHLPLSCDEHEASLAAASLRKVRAALARTSEMNLT